MGTIERSCPARVGLLGNPSDGYFGKTLSFTVQGLQATVWLTPGDRLQLVPHPAHDALEAGSLGELAAQLELHGLGGGVRLLKVGSSGAAGGCLWPGAARELTLHCAQATLVAFWRHCQENGLHLPQCRPFSLRYDTTIPRASGLAGSSAIVIAALGCLMDYYGVRGA